MPWLHKGTGAQMLRTHVTEKTDARHRSRPDVGRHRSRPDVSRHRSRPDVSRHRTAPMWAGIEQPARAAKI